MIGISLQEGNRERLMFASSFIGSMRCRLITEDELVSITPLRKEGRQFGNNFSVHYKSCKVYYRLNKGVSFEINCGAASVGEYSR